MRLQAAHILQQQGAQQEQQGDDQPGMEFLGALGQLRHLVLPVVTARGFSSIHSCTSLVRLYLRSAGQRLQLSAADWEALGALTQLQKLELGTFLVRNAGQPGQLYDTLRKLTRLEDVYWADGWTPAVLPVFAALSSLQAIKGAWGEADGTMPVGDIQCPSVTGLRSLSGKVPFDAFPSLLTLNCAGPLDAASWLSLTNTCPKLKAIVCSRNAQGKPSWASFASIADDASRVAALQGLSSLTALTPLFFVPARRVELAALAQSLPSQLQVLELACRGDMEGGCWGALVALGKLTSLRALTVGVWEALEDPLQAQLFLSAVSHVPKVWLSGVGPRMNEVLAGHHGLGLQLPANMRLTINQLPS